MTEDKPIYISAEDDITTVRERLSHIESRHVTLIIPEHSQLRSLTAWRILHKRARELGKEVSVISTDPLVRSVAKEANFSVASSQSSPPSSKGSGKSGKSRLPSRPGSGRASGGESPGESGGSRGSRGTGGAARGKVTSNFRPAPLPEQASPSTTQQPETGPTNWQNTPKTDQFHQWYADVPQPSPFTKQTEPPTESIQHPSMNALLGQMSPLGNTEGDYGQIYDLDVSRKSPSFGKRSSTQLDEEGAPYGIDDEDYQQAEHIRNSAAENTTTPQTLSSPSLETESISSPQGELFVPSTTPLPFEDVGRYSIRDIRDIQDIQNGSEVHDIHDFHEAQPRFEGSDASYRTTPLPSEGKDPYANMEEDVPFSSLREQHASAMVEGLDTSEHSIQGTSADVIDGEVEYLGESDGGIASSFMPTPIVSQATMHSWGEPLPDEEQPDEGGPSRLYKPSNRSRRSSQGSQARSEQLGQSGSQARSGQLRQQASQVRSGQLGQQGGQGQARMPRTYGAASARRQPEIDDPDYIPPHPEPIEERPTAIISPQEAHGVRNRRISGNIAPASTTPSKKLQGTANNGVGANQTRTPKSPPSGSFAESGATGRALQPVPTRAGSTATSTAHPRQQTQQSVQTGTKKPANAKATKKLAPRRRSSGPAYLIPIVLVAIVIGLLAYLGPTASVAITLPSKSYSHPVTLKAGNGPGVVPSEQFSTTFVATTVGKATGTVPVGTAPATGYATFTNAGSTAITIPSGTIVTSSGGIAFTVQAEAVVTEAGNNASNPIEVPIQAQSPGKSGNVDAGTITVIPNSSLNSIAQANNGIAVSSIKLSVVNTNPTTGGGTGTAPAATAQDINAAKATLNKMLATQYSSWVKQHSTSGDLVGSLSRVETLVNAPTPGSTVAGDGTFTEKLSLSTTILIIRSAALQSATATQMNQALRGDKTYSAYTVVTDSQHPIQVQKLQTKADGKVVTFSFVGAGKIVPNISTQQIQRLIAGKKASDARILLQQLPNVRNVTITTGPHIGSWTPGIIPLWPGHIDIHLVAGT